MSHHAERDKGNSNKSVAKSYTFEQRCGETTLQFFDNRSETSTQEKLQEIANNSRLAKQAVQLQAIVDNYAVEQQRNKLVEVNIDKRRLPSFDSVIHQKKGQSLTPYYSYQRIQIKENATAEKNAAQFPKPLYPRANRLLSKHKKTVTPPVQRWPKIGAEQTDESMLTEISQFLSKHGHHVIDVFPQIFKNINDTFSNDADGAEALAYAANVLLNKEVRQKGRGQKLIMRKLAIIANLVRVASGELEEEKQEAIKLANKLYDDSGLCFGFTEVFKKHARWLTALWEAIAGWIPGVGAEQEILDEFNEHLESTINWAWGEKEDRAMEAVLLLKEAWENMQTQGKDMSYHDLPAWVGNVQGTESDSERVRIGQVTRLIIMPEVESIVNIMKRYEDEIDQEVDSEYQTSTDIPIDVREIIIQQAKEEASNIANDSVRGRSERLKIKSKLKAYLKKVKMDQIGGESVLNEKAEQEQRQQIKKNERPVISLVKSAWGLLQAWSETTGDQDIMIEVSTEAHSMAVHFINGKILFLEPQLFGLVECSDSIDLGKKLHMAITDITPLQEQIDGFPLDFDILSSGKISEEMEMPIKGEERAGILQNLEAESIESFKGVGSDSSALVFLKEANPDLFSKL